MSQLRSLAVAIAMTASFAVNAHAADMPRLPPPIDSPPIVEKRPVIKEIFDSGWYLRGDLGYAWPQVSSATASTGASLSNSSLGKAYDAGFGVGVKSRWFRSDVTIDYSAPFTYSGTRLSAGDTTAKIQSTAVLFNVYADLGTWYRLTPYIGVGVGTANVRVSDIVQPGFNGANSASRWNLAWAAMGGVGWTVAPNLVIDIGYRYRNVGDAKGPDDTTGHLTFRNVAAHEIRAGIRWSFDDLYDPIVH